jgi:hypothetical protein
MDGTALIYVNDVLLAHPYYIQSSPDSVRDGLILPFVQYVAYAAPQSGLPQQVLIDNIDLQILNGDVL